MLDLNPNVIGRDGFTLPYLQGSIHRRDKTQCKWVYNVDAAPTRPRADEDGDTGEADFISEYSYGIPYDQPLELDYRNIRLLRKHGAEARALCAHAPYLDSVDPTEIEVELSTEAISTLVQSECEKPRALRQVLIRLSVLIGRADAISLAVLTATDANHGTTSACDFIESTAEAAATYLNNVCPSIPFEFASVDTDTMITHVPVDHAKALAEWYGPALAPRASSSAVVKA